MKKNILSFFIFINGFCFSQDPHFSQYYASQSTVNPAMVGMFAGEMKVSGLYRQQWPQFGSAFVTGNMAFEWKSGGFKGSNGTDRLALGISALYDKTPDEVLKSQHAYAMIAYHKALDAEGHHRIGLGFMAGYNQRMLDASKLTFGNQFQSGGFTGGVSESFASNKTTSFDVHSGILYSFEDEGRLIYAGVAVYHLMNPKDHFMEGNELVGHVPKRYNLNAGFNIENESLHYAASFLFMRQHAVSQMLIGGTIGIPFSGNGVLYGGSWYRVGESIIPTINLQWDTFNVGVSYDAYLGNKKSLTRPKSFELSIAYRVAPFSEAKMGCFAF